MKNTLIGASIILLTFAGYKLYAMQKDKKDLIKGNKSLEKADADLQKMADKMKVIEIELPQNDMAELWPAGTIQCYKDPGISQDSTLYHIVNQ